VAHEGSPTIGETTRRTHEAETRSASRLVGWPEVRESKLLRVAGICALVGTLLSVAAGIGFRDLMQEMRAEPVLDAIALQSPGTWGLVHLLFLLGTVAWVAALVALAASRTLGAGTGLGWIGSAVLIIGAAVNVVNASIGGFGLGVLADAWTTALESERVSLRAAADTLLPVVGGTWVGSILLFHGIPFVLFGLAVVRSRWYPAWLGWMGAAAGLGSFVIGAAMILDTDTSNAPLFLPFALLASAFMAVLGWKMYRHANLEDRWEDVEQTREETEYRRVTPPPPRPVVREV
jgi:hypothetical protein